MREEIHSSLLFQLLLRLIVDHLADFSAEPGVFTMFSEQLKKTYFNILIKPERLGKYVSQSSHVQHFIFTTA